MIKDANMKKKYTYKAIIRHEPGEDYCRLEWISGKPRTNVPLDAQITIWQEPPKGDKRLAEQSKDSDGDTYTASLRGDRLDWMTPGVKIDKPIEVSITVMEKQLNFVRDEDRGRTYKAILHGKQVEWLDGKPEAPQELEVSVKTPIKRWKSEAERKAILTDALTTLRKSGVFSDIKDPVAWQREIRKDRPLPGRD